MINAATAFYDYLVTDAMSLSDWEDKLMIGWDRMGYYFFRKRYEYFEGFDQDLSYYKYALQLMPLRYRLDGTFCFSKSQRNIKKRNAEVSVVFQKSSLNAEKLILFNAWHQERFGYLSRIEQWTHGTDQPFETMECCVFLEGRLIACSFFDETEKVCYSTLAFYDPAEIHRSLGIFTLIAEIEYGMARGKSYHHPGHAHYENTKYDYKKRFSNAECFDWETQTWMELNF
jgi:arginyl-tRNA--protein-N-Asp/Glu arginylyltransferase